MSRNDELLEAFAAELKARRNRADLSQDELARRAAVNRTYIAKLELAKNQPTLCVLHDLAIALNNDLPELIQGIYSRYKQKRLHRNAVNAFREKCLPSTDVKEVALLLPDSP